MSWRIGLCAVALVSSLVVAGAAVVGGCEGQSCVKDTDCELPLICRNSACVPVGSSSDAIGPDDAEAQLDVVDDDDGGSETEAGPDDATSDDGMVDGSDDGSADDGGPCGPVLSAAFTAVTSAADEEERPSLVSSATGFVLFARPPGPVVDHALSFRRFQANGTPVGPTMWTLSSIVLGPIHPLLEFPDGTFVTAFIVASTTGPGVWVKIVPATGSTGPVPAQVPGTSTASFGPSVTFDGTSAVVAWGEAGSGTVDLKAQPVDPLSGIAVGSSVTLASGPTGTGAPCIVWGDTRHALAYLAAADGSIHVLSLAHDLAIQSDHVLTPADGQAVVGSPALVWTGTEFGLLWETRGPSAAQLHLATFLPDAVPTEHAGILADVPLSGSEQGQVALAWNPDRDEWGVAWRRTMSGRVGVALARVDAADFHTVEAPVDVRSASTTAAHPALAYNAGFYMVSWVERSGTDNPVYVATYGCAP